MSKDFEQDLEFLSPRAAALRRVGSKKSYLAQKLIFMFFIAFMIWAHFSELHEVTKGTGKITSSTHIQTISNLEGGIIKEILVRDDQVVNQGQVLVRLDKTIAQAKLTQDLENYYRFLGTAERLRAQITNQRNFAPSRELRSFAPNLAFQEEARFKSNRQKMQNEFDIAKRDLQIKEQELEETETKISDAKRQRDYVKKQIGIAQPLAEKKIYARMDFIKLKRDLAEQDSQLNALRVTLDRQKTAIQQAKERISQVRIRYHDDDLIELRDVEGRLAEARGAQIADRDRVSRTEIRSPIAGTIRDIKVNTIGGVIQPGETIMDIVPLNDTLIVEAQIPPSDIGFIREGMPATIKVTAFDFSTYGGLQGIVEEISADTITDKRDVTYYRVMLRTTSNVLEKDGKRHFILPGMLVEVDILTGHKSVLTYLMKPFTRALHNAMTER